MKKPSEAELRAIKNKDRRSESKTETVHRFLGRDESGRLLACSPTTSA